MAIQKVPGSTESVLTGATIAQIGDDRFLYVADIRQGTIAVYDTNFNRVEVGKHAFDDEHGRDAVRPSTRELALAAQDEEITALAADR